MRSEEPCGDRRAEPDQEKRGVHPRFGLCPACPVLPTGTLCAADAGSAIPGAEMGQLTPLEPYQRAPLPPVDKTIPPPPVPLPPVPLVPENRGAFNPRTGERYLPSGKGVYNPRTGEYYPPSGRGYINPRTGEYFPPVDQNRQ